MSTHRMTTRRGANHGLHLVLTIITMGLWAPVWLIVAMVGRRETTWVQRDEYRSPLESGWNPPGTTWNPYTQRWESR